MRLRYLGLIAVLLSGCSVTSSENVRTSGIWVSVSVAHHADDRVLVLAVLRVGGPTGTIIDLTGDDSLRVNGTQMIEWVEPITNLHWSRAILTPDPAGRYDIDLVRPGEVVTTTVTTPELPAILSTSAATALQSGEALTVDWDVTSPGDNVSIDISGSCIADQRHVGVPDTGSFTSDPVTDVLPAQPSDCPVEVTVTRNVDGGVNSAFEGGDSDASTADASMISFETTL